MSLSDTAIFPYQERAGLISQFCKLKLVEGFTTSADKTPWVSGVTFSLWNLTLLTGTVDSL